MGILHSIRQFIKPFIKNPITVGIIAYLIFKILQKHLSKEESFDESIKVISKIDSFEIIFDTETKAYSVIDGRGVHNDSKSFNNIEEATKWIRAQSRMKELVEKYRK